MATKHQSCPQGNASSYSKFIKLPLTKEQKYCPNSKKLFSRKPLNTSQNSSRILSSRLKTQEEELNSAENLYLMNNSIGAVINQSKNIKFVSAKNSKSLQKLFVSSSVQNLPTLSLLNKKDSVSTNQTISKISSNNNKLNLSPKFTDKLISESRLGIIIDLEKDDYNSKDNIGSTELSSNEYLYHEEPLRDDFRNHQSQRSKRNQTFSFYYPKDKRILHKQCPSCLINSQRIKELEELNTKLEDTLQLKESEIKKLNQKTEKLTLALKDNQDFKTNLEYEINILKEKQNLTTSQKEEIENAFKKLQLNFSKLTQEIKYKDLELNISKIYKTKSLELEMKVETLRNELNRAKTNVNKLKSSSKPSERLRDTGLKLDLRNLGKYPRQNSQKRLKQPKLARVYSEDSVFSLSSQECD